MSDDEFFAEQIEGFKQRMLTRVNTGELTPEQVKSMAEASMNVNPRAATSQGYQAAWEELQQGQ